MRKILALTATIAAINLSGCAPTLSAVVPGVNTFNKTNVNLLESWSSVPDALHNGKGVVLTKDGMTLNRLHIVTVEPEKTMVDKVSNTQEYPTYTSEMSKIQQIDFVKASLGRMGLKNIVTANVKPTTIGGQSGVEFGISGKYESGLNMKGHVGIAPAGENLNVVAFIAPQEYYYNRDIAEVMQIVDTMTFAN